MASKIKVPSCKHTALSNMKVTKKGILGKETVNSAASLSFSQITKDDCKNYAYGINKGN